MELHGLLVLDKPGGMTSREAVNRIQRQLPRGARIGHTGTLDPLATGVLVACLGQATRLAEYVQAMRKTYHSTFLLGSTSDTDDADGKITPWRDATPLPRSVIDLAVAAFVGEIEQTPPAFSAAKVAGQRAYDLARSGAQVDLKPRRVAIYGIDVASYEWPNLQLEIRCSKGTYIRSIARDLGKRMGCGGLVRILRRVAVGSFAPEMATPLDATLATIRERLRPMSEALSELPRAVISDGDAQRLSRGQAIRGGDQAGTTAVFLANGELVGIAECRNGSLQPTKILLPRN
jgi:tRNA pseudouridine55 synthase